MLPALLLTITLFGQQHSSPKSATSDSVELHLGKGYEALNQDRYYDAAENFRAALKVDPTLVIRARFPLATALFQLRSFREARHELEMVRREVGERPSICYYFGRLKPEEQNYKSAVANLKGDCEQGITVCEEHDIPDDEEMLATLEAANLKPATPEPHQQMLSIYTRAGRADLAQAEQQKLHQLAKSSKNEDRA